MTLASRVRTRLVEDAREPTSSNVVRAVRTEGGVLSDRAVLELSGEVGDALAGAGPLAPLLRIPGITDVLVNGPDDVWIDSGDGLTRMPVTFADVEEIRQLAQRLAASAGRRLDDAHPFVDARLPDGTRFHAVLQPIAVSSPALSLRIPRRQPFTLDDLIRLGALHPDLAVALADLVEHRRAFLISGSTGTGKTTVLGALLACIPSSERIVIVEDSAELHPTHAHCIRLQSRLPNIEGAGGVTMRELIRQSLRMRPDRIVVGEVRGAEVVELLTALNTGHEGGCGTVHANSASDVPARLEALALTAGLDRAALHALVGAGLDAVVHIDRDNRGRRVVAGINHVVREADGFVRVVPVMDALGRAC
jgi:pilus assembly protein CpaF